MTQVSQHAKFRCEFSLIRQRYSAFPETTCTRIFLSYLLWRCSLPLSISIVIRTRESNNVPSRPKCFLLSCFHSSRVYAYVSCRDPFCNVDIPWYASTTYSRVSLASSLLRCFLRCFQHFYLSSARFELSLANCIIKLSYLTWYVFYRCYNLLYTPCTQKHFGYDALTTFAENLRAFLAARAANKLFIAIRSFS